MLKTLLLLLEEFGALHVKAEVVSAKYLGLTKRETSERAHRGELPFPTFRAETCRSPLLVDLRDVAEWIDTVRDSNRQDWRKLR